MPTHSEVIERLIAERDEARELARGLVARRAGRQGLGASWLAGMKRLFPWLDDGEQSEE